VTAHPVQPAEPSARDAFRKVLGHFATGVTAVTGLVEGSPTGMIVNAFSSVSLDPPLVSVCAAHSSRTWPHLRQDGRICVNILAEHQQATSWRLSASGRDKFAGVPWTPSPSGLPVLDGTLAWLECEIRDLHPAGDHEIAVALVRHMEIASTTAPLVFYQGRYGTCAFPA
jgi:flavin reductase (DIM6/NTAB) family NADH-FMN oxidoreductase RutF